MDQETTLDDEFFESRVHPLVIPTYTHKEAGLSLTLHDMTIYLLNEEDFSLTAGEFDPEKHEHAIPKFEMARVYILLCALTGDDLGFTADDRESDPVYPIYEKAFHKLVATETNRAHFPGIARVGIAAGFHVSKVN